MVDPRGERWAQDTSKFGYRMLQRMGWKEGNGLGLHQDGITQHVKASNKFDNAGIGLDPKKRTHAWESNTSAFESILQNLNKAFAAKSTSPDPTPADIEEDGAAEKAAKKKDKKQKKAEKKLKKRTKEAKRKRNKSERGSQVC